MMLWSWILEFGPIVIHSLSPRSTAPNQMLVIDFMRTRAMSTAVSAIQWLLSTGEIGSDAYFHRAKAGAFDAQVALPIAISDRIELRIAGGYDRYWYAMYPEIGDKWVAGGALDEYLSGTITAAITY